MFRKGKEMRKNKILFILTSLILILSAIASIAGLLSYHVPSNLTFTSITGESVKIFGYGLYKNDSVSIATQGIASDFMTLFLVVPITLVVLIRSKRSSIKSGILLTGLLGYFFYTYTSYVFLWNYNTLFLVYVALMSLSFYAFLISFLAIDQEGLLNSISDAFPTKRIAGFMLALALMVSLLWLGKIVPSLFSSVPPIGLEHYTTLVIQALDLGFVIPASVIAAILLLRKNALGYLLGSVLMVKYIALLMTISAMFIFMLIQDSGASWIEGSVFLGFTAVCIYIFSIMLKHIKPTESPNRIIER